MFANWDENHSILNEELLKKVSIYKNEADRIAKTLPHFERKDVNKILDKSIKEILIIFLFHHLNLTKEDRLVNETVMKNLQSKTETNIGFVLFNNSKLDNWVVDTYGKEFETSQNILNRYNIDYLGARKIKKKIIAEVVPYTGGENFYELGYMLSNKPSFNAYKIIDKLPWNSGGVSKYTLQKFKIW